MWKSQLYRTMYIAIFLMVLLAGCATERSLGSEEHESVSQPVTRSEIAVPSIEREGIPVGSVQIIGGDEDSLREFLRRWFAPLYPSSTPERETIIWLGALPEDMPVDFPLPDGAQVVASVQDPYTALQVIANVPASLEEVLAIYPQVLAENGWNLPPETTPGSGFLSAADPWFTLCSDQEEMALTVQAFPGEAGQTDLRLHLYTQNTKFMCDPVSNQGMDPAYEMIPTLKVPAGTVMTGGGSSSGDGSAESTSEIRTEMSPLDLSAHFSNQLEATGWQLLERDSTDQFAWSAWSTSDQDGVSWSGTLIILKNPELEDFVFALMRVVRVEE